MRKETSCRTNENQPIERENDFLKRKNICDGNQKNIARNKIAPYFPLV